MGWNFIKVRFALVKNILKKTTSYTSHITKIAPKNSVLLCVRAPVGIVNITEREICIGRGLCAVNPRYEITSDFWFYWLQSLQSDFEQKATGTTFRAISVDVIKNQVIAIPPVEEQKRILIWAQPSVRSFLSLMIKRKSSMPSMIFASTSSVSECRSMLHARPLTRSFYRRIYERRNC